MSRKRAIKREAFEFENYSKEEIQDFFNDKDVQDNIINVPSKLNSFITGDTNGWNAFLMVCTNIKTLTKDGKTTEMADYIAEAKNSVDTSQLYQAAVTKGYVYFTDTLAGYGDTSYRR